MKFPSKKGLISSLLCRYILREGLDIGKLFVSVTRNDVTVHNPLTTDDAIWHCLTLAACYQLA